MRKGLRKTAALAAALMLVLCAAPMPAHAADIQNGLPAIASGHNTAASGTTVVGFGGYEWYVVGYNGAGVNPGAGTITLLAKNANFGTTAFRDTATHPVQSYNNDSNNYESSTLQAMMDELYAAFGAADSREQAMIAPRTLVAAQFGNNGDIQGTRNMDAYVWPLSQYDYNILERTQPDTVSAFGSADWWLRSPVSSDSVNVVDSAGGNAFDSRGVSFLCVIRPAFTLTLPSVLFTSAASGASGKSSATAGGGLVGAQVPSGAVKLTVLDVYDANTNPTGQSTPALALHAASSGTGTLAFDYTGATTGQNQYLSCVLMDGASAVSHYGKLAECATAGGGTLALPFAGVADGSYTLRLFCEQANADNHTDYAGTPVDVSVTVAGGVATVNNWAGAQVYEVSSPFPTVTDKSAANITATIEGDYSGFTGGGSVYNNTVDAATPLTDTTHYTHQSGSTQITLTPAYLQTLPNGSYEIQVNFAGGHYARLTLVVNVPAAGDGQQPTQGATEQGPASPQTGDATSLPGWAGLGALGLCGLALCGMAVRRRRLGRKAG